MALAACARTDLVLGHLASDEAPGGACSDTADCTGGGVCWAGACVEEDSVGAAITINNDEPYTNHLDVQLTLEAPGATRFALAASAADCATTTTWLTMAVIWDHVLPSQNVENTVYAKFEDADGNTTGCVSDTIVHDNLPPLPPKDLRVSWSGVSDLSRSPTLYFSSTDRGPAGIASYQARVVNADAGASVSTWGGVVPGGTLTGLSTLVSGSFYRVEVFAVDRAGNASVRFASTAWSDAVVEQKILGIFPLFAQFRFGDLDGDSDLDVVVFSKSYPEVTWYESTYDAQVLAPPKTLLPDALAPQDLQLADLDGDGDLDIVVCDATSNDVAWYPNEMTEWGGSGARHLVASSADPRAVQIDDLDSDGDLDLIVASFGDNLVASYANDGFGVFGAAQPIASAQIGPAWMLLANVDGDAHLDLVVGSTSDTQTSWYHALGGGSFSMAHLIANASAELVPRDLDDDGALDLLGASRWYRNTDGGGTFSTEITIAEAATSRKTDAADLDGDGDADLAMALGSEQFVWSTNAGTGTFGAAVSLHDLPFGPEARNIATVDLDSDGDADVLGEQLDPEALIWIENTGGSFAAARGVGNPLTNRIVDVLLTDLDRDGDVDVVMSGGGGTFWLENTDGLGAFAAPQQLTNQSGYLEIADLDGDTAPDLVLGWTNSIGWCRNTDGRAQFGPVVSITTAANGLQSLTVADIDGDGDMDVLSASYDDRKLAWYRNDGAGGFGAQLVIATVLAETRAIAAGDFDGDGDLDVAGANTMVFNSYVWWYRNADGNGTFSGAVQTIANGARELKVTDLDGDGDQDIVTPYSWLQNTDGVGLFSAPIALSGFDGLCRGSPADLDGDGDVDVAHYSVANHAVYWRENAGDGTFSANSLLTNRSGGHGCAVGDVNGDGRPEIVVSSTENTVTELFLSL